MRLGNVAFKLQDNRKKSTVMCRVLMRTDAEGRREPNSFKDFNSYCNSSAVGQHTGYRFVCLRSVLDITGLELYTVQTAGVTGYRNGLTWPRTPSIPKEYNRNVLYSGGSMAVSVSITGVQAVRRVSKTNRVPREIQY